MSQFSLANHNIESNLKDTKEKLAFVEKLIRFASSACGRPLSVNAKKVLAGIEPEHTNEMLQELANAGKLLTNKQLTKLSN